MRRLLPDYPAASRGGDGGDRAIGWFLTIFARLLGVMAVAAGLFALAVLPAVQANAASTCVSFLGLAVLVGVAGFAAGSFTGFLFGIPRTRPGEAAGPAGTLVSNTNLEQLSDGLTKILVGVGLVEIHAVDRGLTAFRDAIDRAFVVGDGQPLAGAGMAACLILIGSAIAGFLAAYLKAKTDLMRAFREPIDMVQSALGEVTQSLIADAARAVLDRPSAPVDGCARETAAKLVQFVPPGSGDPALHRLTGLAHAVLKNYPAAADAMRCAIRLRAEQGAGNDPALVALATRALTLAGEMADARALGATASARVNKPLDQGMIEHRLAAMFAALYSANGFTSAIGIGEALAQDGNARNSGRLWLYLACAHGQHHAALLSAGATPGELADARDKALAAVREAIRLDPQHGPALLRSLWDPASPDKPLGENDLESLHDDAAFTALFAALQPG